MLGQASPTLNPEDFSRFFCSELAAAALEEAGMVPRLNASEVTPIDLCQWAIYEPTYHQLFWDEQALPEQREIKRYNSYDPALWAEQT